MQLGRERAVLHAPCSMLPYVVQGDELKGSLWQFLVGYNKGEWSEEEKQK